MKSLKIELPDDQYKALERLAHENGAEPEVLIQAQVTNLVKTYEGKGLTPELKKHLKASIEENRHLLERLAK